MCCKFCKQAKPLGVWLGTSLLFLLHTLKSYSESSRPGILSIYPHFTGNNLAMETFSKYERGGTFRKPKGSCSGIYYRACFPCTSSGTTFWTGQTCKGEHAAFLSEQCNKLVETHERVLKCRLHTYIHSACDTKLFPHEQWCSSQTRSQARPPQVAWESWN